MRLISWLLSLVILAAFVLALFLYWGADDYLSRTLSKEFGTKVTIRSLGFTLHTITLKGLEVFNPPPAKLPHAFSAHRIELEAPLSAYFKKTIHLEDLQIDSPKVGVELLNSSGSQNNWTHILKNMPPSPEGRTYIIDRLVITNIQFDIVKSNGKRIEVPAIPYLEFRHLGPLTANELGRLIFQSILTILARDAALSKILNNIVPLTEKLLQNVPSEKVLKQVERESSKLLKKGEKKASKLLKQLTS